MLRAGEPAFRALAVEFLIGVDDTVSKIRLGLNDRCFKRRHSLGQDLEGQECRASASRTTAGATPDGIRSDE